MIGRALLSVASAALLVPAALLYRDDLAGRKPARDFVAKFNVETRRPEVAQTVGYAPTPDWTSMIVADAALRDAFEPVNLLDVTPQVREAWINAAAHVDEELAYAKRSLLDAIATRPGWPFYQSLLGQTMFAIESRSFSPDLVKRPDTWALPLLNAARGAPYAASAWRSLAAAYLQTWPVLANAHNATAGEVFHHAFADPDFVRVAFPDAARLLGTDRAISYVPDTPQSLSAAFDFFAKANDVAHAWPMRQRWERAEWSDRVDGIAEIERHARRGDVDDVRSLCDQWTSRHSVWDFDSPAAHEQAARILDLWPGGRRGAWTTDPLADVTRYLMTRNGDADRYASIIARQIDAFSGVPAPVVAEAKLLGGDANGAERIAQSAEDAGSLSWTDYFLTLATRDKTALQRVPAAAMETHEALIVRGVSVPDDDARTTCAARTAVAMHGARSMRLVRVGLTASQPTLISVGVNRARSATLLVDGERSVDFALLGWRDKTIWSQVLCGAPDHCASVTPATAAR